MAAALLSESGVAKYSGPTMSYFENAKGKAVMRMLERGTNCAVSTSIGRLFDGVSALLGICCEASYEGEGAVLLEAAAGESEEMYSVCISKNSPEELNAGNTYFEETLQNIVSCCRTGQNSELPAEEAGKSGAWRFDWRPMIREICADLENGIPTEICAVKFMNTLCESAVRIACGIAEETGIRTVVLSGGVFQNQYLLGRLSRMLSEAGLTCYTHRRVSTNDEGISLGQLAAASRCKLLTY